MCHQIQQQIIHYQTGKIQLFIYTILQSVIPVDVYAYEFLQSILFTFEKLEYIM